MSVLPGRSWDCAADVADGGVFCAKVEGRLNKCSFALSCSGPRYAGSESEQQTHCLGQSLTVADTDPAVGVAGVAEGAFVAVCSTSLAEPSDFVQPLAADASNPTYYWGMYCCRRHLSL